MGIKAQIRGTGEDGKFHELKVNGEGEIGVVIHQHPPINESVASFVFVNEFADDAGSNNMAIDGLITPTSFCVSAQKDVDTFIKYVDIELADSTINGWGDFGGITALTNGVELFWESINHGRVPIDIFYDNKGFFRKAYNEPVVLKVTGGGDDTILPKMNLQILFGGEWGIQLVKNTTDKLCLSINDDLTALSTFNANASGRRI